MKAKLQQIHDLLLEAEEIWDEISEEVFIASEGNGDLIQQVQYVNVSLPNTRLNFESIAETIN
ncbi:hypothetical protein [Tellurirhabdus bombi]|uniref:hypothetical protein n=1 Tax=Tellurirhabdus bombi TaxID=2907205 RepID=UPI001F337583|nr:hypothetical protein [Tellurirhabdus bombi]